jgi:hypothetical protein
MNARYIGDYVGPRPAAQHAAQHRVVDRAQPARRLEWARDDLSLGIINLADRAPSFRDSALGCDSAVHDPARPPVVAVVATPLLTALHSSAPRPRSHRGSAPRSHSRGNVAPGCLECFSGGVLATRDLSRVLNQEITMKLHRHHHHLTAGVGAACVASALLLCAAPSQAARPSESDCAALAAPNRLEQRLLDKAGQGVDTLRQYIFITRGIHGYDMFEVVKWMDARRATAAACQARAEQGEETLASSRTPR